MAEGKRGGLPADGLAALAAVRQWREAEAAEGEPDAGDFAAGEMAALLAEGERSGPATDAEAFFADLRARGATAVRTG